LSEVGYVVELSLFKARYVSHLRYFTGINKYSRDPNTGLVQYSKGRFRPVRGIGIPDELNTGIQFNSTRLNAL
jgi:hypothetical protein